MGVKEWVLKSGRCVKKRVKKRIEVCVKRYILKQCVLKGVC